MKKQGGMFTPVRIMVSFFILWLTVFLSVPVRLLAQDIPEAGYDENTEITIKGKVIKASLAPNMGLECMIVQSRSCLFRVLIAPMWFIKQIGFNPKDGDSVEITGSKFFGEDGMISLLAKYIKFYQKGRKYFLRDKSGRPVWHTKGVGESSCLHIFYTTPAK
ncbi:MAG: hypothetical protein ACUVQ6_08125 [Dissulfurimicrobium sp.]|uniref:hypothetical protein n=1 Tax=Dissulfurimicrobium sp. TaxID=2022436 RepID=UPI00404B72D0